MRVRLAESGPDRPVSSTRRAAAAGCGVCVDAAVVADLARPRMPRLRRAIRPVRMPRSTGMPASAIISWTRGWVFSALGESMMTGFEV